MAEKVKSVEKAEKPREASAVRGAARLAASPVPQRSARVSGIAPAPGNLAIQRLLRSGAIQAKLTVNQPGDVYEQEADRVADQIVSAAPAGRVQRKCAACAGGGPPCPHCAEEERLQAKEKPGSTPQVSSKAAAQIASLRGGGQPLSPAVRAFFEPRLGRDFGGVRIHTDGPAAESARAINTRAYTAGQDVAFGAGEYAPESREGRKLLAHELTHVVQQEGSAAGRVQRQTTNGADPEDTSVEDSAESTGVAFRSITNPNGIDPGAAGFPGVTLTTDSPTALAEMWGLVELQGKEGPTTFYSWLKAQATPALPGGLPEGAAAEDKALEDKVLSAYGPAVKDVNEEVTTFLSDFETKAKGYALLMLKASEIKTKAEGLNYGITGKSIEKKREGVTETSVEHHMDVESTLGKGLQDAAKVLLARRKEIEKREDAQRMAMEPAKDPEGMGMVATPEYDVIGKEIKTLKEDYNKLRSQLSAQYPILAGFSELGKSTGNLETLAEKGPGLDMAAVLGTEIADKLAKIDKVRNGLGNKGDVNVWRLPKVVGVTGAELGVEDDPVRKKLVEEKVAQEEPGILADLALGVLNIVAIALAGITGGVSLAVAAGVNVAVAAVHVQEYLMQEALSGTDFDRAQALSQEEPSLFWLAMDIVGAVMDAPAMFKSFRSMASLVKAAQAAKEGEAAVEALQTLRTAAKEAHGAEFAEKVVVQVKRARGGDTTAALRAAGATKGEIDLLQAAGKAADAEAAVGIGKGLKTAVGEMNLAESGRLFSCASPCIPLRKKYAEIFVQRDDFLVELVQLEAEAEEIGKASRAAKASKNADELANATKRADELKQKAAALEKRIHDANPHLAAVPDEAAVIDAAKQTEAEAAVTTGRLPAKTDELEKLKPVRDKPPVEVDIKDPDVKELWEDYVAYYEDRLSCLQAGKDVKAPLSWRAYSDFRDKFLRGTKYQEKVLGKLAEEAALPSGERELFQGMQKPIVQSNVGVVGQVEGESTKFVDQLVVDGATIGPGKTPSIQAFSNKSRDFDEWFKNQNLAKIRDQVRADVQEAVSKYGGDITLRRPKGPLKELFNRTVKVEKVTLVYDKSLAEVEDVQKFIRRIAKAPGVEVIFR